MDAEVSTHTFLTMIIEESVCFMSCEPNFFFAVILMWYTRNIFLFLFINWTLRMSDNLPERGQILGHAHILCITVQENRIIINLTYDHDHWLFTSDIKHYTIKQISLVFGEVCDAHHFSFCVVFVFVLCLVYPMFPFSLDCQFCFGPSVFSNVYCNSWKYVNKYLIQFNSI
jgi:hypothetical protein